MQSRHHQRQRPDPGIAYTEWTVGRSSQKDAHWTRQRLYPRFPAKGSKGPRPLVQMAINVIADNVGDMSSELLENIPTRLLWRVWAFLEARGVNFHAWRIISRLLLAADDEKTLGLYRFRQHICKPSGPLPLYAEPLTSSHVDFITHLVLSGGCDFSTQDLLCLSDMSNLGVLELICPADELRLPFTEVDDLLLRGWSEKERPFPLLRILRIWGCDGLSHGSLQSAARFPSLALYDVKGFSKNWRSASRLAASSGWTFEEISATAEDSHLDYLLSIARVDDFSVAKRRQQLARSIDIDLASLSSDSRCVIKFVPQGEAPPLVDYLTDSGKELLAVPSWDADAASREARACQKIAFEVWGYWLYSFIGQLSRDRDLERFSAPAEEQAVAGPFVLPSKPTACLYLGHSGREGISFNPAYLSRGLFSTKKFKFTRPRVIDGEVAPETEAHVDDTCSEGVAEEVPAVEVGRRRKRLRPMEDMLESFSR